MPTVYHQLKVLRKKCWPVVFGLVELPRTLRNSFVSFNNKIISGVFICNQKPTSNMIFESLILDRKGRVLKKENKN